MISYKMHTSQGTSYSKITPSFFAAYIIEHMGYTMAHQENLAHTAVRERKKPAVLMFVGVRQSLLNHFFGMTETRLNTILLILLQIITQITSIQLQTG